MLDTASWKHCLCVSSQCSRRSLSSALLQVRNRIEAQRVEQQRKEEAAMKGLPTDDIHVEPGTVDWLYGEHMPDPNEEETQDEERSVDVEELPMIKAKDAQDGESIFSSGQGTRQKQTAHMFIMEGKAITPSVQLASAC